MAVVLRSIPQECSLGRKMQKACLVSAQKSSWNCLEPRVCTKNPSQRKAMLSWKKSIHLDFGSSNSNESGPYPHDVATSCDFKLSLGENLSFWPRAHTSTWILGERQRIDVPHKVRGCERFADRELTCLRFHSDIAYFHIDTGIKKVTYGYVWCHVWKDVERNSRIQ